MGRIFAMLVLTYVIVRWLDHGVIEGEYGRRHVYSPRLAKQLSLWQRDLKAEPASFRVGGADVHIRAAWVSHVGRVSFRHLFTDDYTLVPYGETFMYLEVAAPDPVRLRLRDALKGGDARCIGIPRDPEAMPPGRPTVLVSGSATDEVGTGLKRVFFTLPPEVAVQLMVTDTLNPTATGVPVDVH